MRLAAVVLGGDGHAAARTRSSLDGDPCLAHCPVHVAPVGAPAPWACTGADAVLLLRAGDEVLPDATPHRLAALEAGASVALAGHRLRGRGQWGTDVLPPEPIDPGALLLHCPLELGAVLARAEALPAGSELPPDEPGGDVALLAALAASPGLAVVAQAAVVVRTAARHGLGRRHRLAATLALAGTRLARSSPAAPALRRRALELAFLDAGAGAGAGAGAEGSGTAPPPQPPPAGEWWRAALAEGDAGELGDILEDLHWALGRQADRLGALRGELGPAAVAKAGLVPDEEDLRAEVERLGLELQRRHQQVDWLHREVAARDREVARLAAEVDALRAGAGER